ncbi:MAG: hypothetical protein KDK36_15935 [Leptospiraceae bacterium]|nr:hypothetical protein [Leptospiraceae bacterium]
MDKDMWKNFFKGNAWLNNEIIEADNENLFIHLTSYKIPRGMDLKHPGWGLWHIGDNTFLPLKGIPSNLVPIRKIGTTIFLKNKKETEFYYITLENIKEIIKIKSSKKIKGWFPRADGSIAYILADEDCNKMEGKNEGKQWSVCVLNSNYQDIERIALIEPCFNPMLSGKSDNYITYWFKSLEEKLWVLESINLENSNGKILTKSNKEDIEKDASPIWLSWIESNWVIYEDMKIPEKKETKDKKDLGEKKEESDLKEAINSRTFTVHNLNNDKKRKVVLDEKGILMLEPGNYGNRNFHYNPYLIIMDFTEKSNRVKIIEVNELKVVNETEYPLNEKNKDYKSVYYP